MKQLSETYLNQMPVSCLEAVVRLKFMSFLISVSLESLELEC